MIRHHLLERGVSDPRVIEAMREVAREDFIPDQYIVDAYGDHPLPISDGQTISQPYIVALMSQLCLLKGDEKVLEIGSGSGYQTAILSRLAAEIYSIERIKNLKETAEKNIAKPGCANVTLIHGDGYMGLPEKSPFDVIILTASPEKIPAPLTEQLAMGGRLVAPVGDKIQKLIRITKTAEGLHSEDIIHVRFVPMVPGFNK
jgi:protein-L-isoaspartate(D-aspartate) O-methyltransferase